jgi:hypothetical protein
MRMNSKANQEELTTRNRGSVQSTNVQRRDILCTQEHGVAGVEFLFLGYYSEFFCILLCQQKVENKIL